jgi:hypothetical protein
MAGESARNGANGVGNGETTTGANAAIATSGRSNSRSARAAPRCSPDFVP